MPLIAWLGVAILVGVGGACGTRSKINHFVVPTGYSGPIVLASDPSFESDSYWDGERYVHHVPATAIVCVRSDDVLRPFFRESAAYADGTPIYARSRDLPSPPTSDSPRIQAIGSWGSGIEEGYLHWFALGTEAEVQALTSRFFGAGDAIELAMPAGVTIERTKSDNFSYLRQYCGKQMTPNNALEQNARP
jgi:hypothetical protein